MTTEEGDRRRRGKTEGKRKEEGKGRKRRKGASAMTLLLMKEGLMLSSRSDAQIRLRPVVMYFNRA